MKHDTGYFRTVDGLDLYHQSWLPEAGPRAALVVVHGWGEHSGRYQYLVRHLVEHRYAVHAFDHRGHGRSPGQRGHIDRWSEYRSDLQTFVLRNREQYEVLPLFLFGHSLGALITLDYVLHHPQGLRGVVLSASAVEPVEMSKPHMVALSRVMSRLWPRFSVPLGSKAAILSRDPVVVEAARNDPLMHQRATARWGTESLDAIARLLTQVADLAVPALFVHGEADRFSLVDGSRRLFDATRIADKTLRLYPDRYHELHNDLEREEVLADIQAWLEAHL